MPGKKVIHLRDLQILEEKYRNKKFRPAKSADPPPKGILSYGEDTEKEDSSEREKDHLSDEEEVEIGETSEGEGDDETRSEQEKEEERKEMREREKTRQREMREREQEEHSRWKEGVVEEPEWRNRGRFRRESGRRRRSGLERQGGSMGGIRERAL